MAPTPPRFLCPHNQPCHSSVPQNLPYQRAMARCPCSFGKERCSTSLQDKGSSPTVFMSSPHLPPICQCHSCTGVPNWGSTQTGAGQAPSRGQSLSSLGSWGHVLLITPRHCRPLLQPRHKAGPGSVQCPPVPRAAPKSCFPVPPAFISAGPCLTVAGLDICSC